VKKRVRRIVMSTRLIFPRARQDELCRRADMVYGVDCLNTARAAIA
jgi:hypothetical protein